MKRPVIFLCTILLFLNTRSQETVGLSPAKALSQFSLKAWDMDMGVPADMVIGLLQDSTGYIWLATFKGIARFDGVNFSIYNHINSDAIESVTTQSLAKDSENNLWFGSQKGLVKYTNNRFVRDANLNELNSVSVEALFFDPRNNTLWIGTTSDGVFRYNSGELKPLPDFLSITRSVVKAINSDIDGYIWIGTEDGKAIRYDGTRLQQVVSSNPLGSVGSFYSSDSGNFWITAENGVFKLVDDEIVLQKNIPVSNANVLIEDNHNTLWIGTNNGLFRYHLATGFLDILDEQIGLPNNIIRDIIADIEGNLWIASYRKGIFKLTDGLITNFSETEGLSSNIITAVVQVGSDFFYVADEHGVINVLSNGKISRLNLKADITRDRLKSLYIDSKQNLWVSSYEGLLKRTPDGEEIDISHSANLPTKSIRLTFEDNQGNIWIGTRSSGLFKLTPRGVIEEFSLRNGLSSNYIMAIVQDLTGRIVVATKNGINIINNNLIEKVIDMECGLPSNFSFNIHIDTDNIFWVSSNDGIIRIENDSDIFVFNIQNGLFDNTLFDILEDDYGYFWLPTDIGIVSISKYELNSFAKGKANSYSFRVYGRSDGMKNPRCTGATKSIKTKDGRMFFNTSGGVAIVNPKDARAEIIQSGVIIEEVMINDESLPQFQKYEIQRGNNRILFKFTAINYRHSDKLKFRYRLEPFDNQWIDAGTSRAAFYTNISPGNYLFTVQSSINENEWTQEPASVKLVVYRSWWQTWWFRVGVAFVISLFIWLIFKARTYAVKLRNQELERLVEERTALIEQQKVELEYQSAKLEKLSIVASHTNNAVMIMSPQGEIQWVNESFTRIYEYTVDEFVKHKGKNLIWVSKDPNIQYVIKKCIEEQVATSYTVQVNSKSGKPIWIQTNLTPIKNNDGSVRAIVAIDSDITELKQVESEMIAMNDEIFLQAESILQQKEEIQSQRDELEQVNNLLIKHTQNIEASIWYALTIQNAILPTKESIDKYFENFIVFKPRDIVSGDFYWFTRLTRTSCILAIADCTGHGVPGALMSMIGSRLLSEIVSEREITDPAQILTQLNRLVNVVLKQDSEQNIDGMDIGICFIEKNDEGFDVTYSGANRPLYLNKKGSGSFTTIKGNRKSIGGIMPDLDVTFQNRILKLSSGDLIVMNTDGYVDQNGSDGKKFGVNRLLQFILERINLPINAIGEQLDIALDEYRGKHAQRDDATILGFRL